MENEINFNKIEETKEEPLMKSMVRITSAPPNSFCVVKRGKKYTSHMVFAFRHTTIFNNNHKVIKTITVPIVGLECYNDKMMSSLIYTIGTEEKCRYICKNKGGK